MSPITGRALPHVRVLIAAFAAAALLAPAAAAARPQPSCRNVDDVPTASTIAAAEDSVSCLINVERAKRGLRPVTHLATLGATARAYSRDMVRRDFFAHVTPTGGTLTDRMRRARYGSATKDWSAGEIIGWGTGSLATPAALADEWLASPSHRSIMLDPRFKQFGAGIAAGVPEREDAQASGGGATYTVEFGVIG